MTHPAVTTAYSRDQAEVYDDRRFSHPAGQRVHRAEADLLFWALERVQKPGKVLEVGCGTGRLLVEARRAGYGVDGADASPNMLSMLRAKLAEEHPNIQLDVAEAAKLPHGDGQFDLVYSIRMLNQTESPAYALDAVAEMIRVARRGGYILVEFVNHYRPRLGTARRPTTRLRPREVAERAQKCGAKVVAYRGAFFLGVQTFMRTPAIALGAVAGLDRVLSRALPRLCARTYILLQKDSGAKGG